MSKLGLLKDWDKSYYKEFFKKDVPFEIFGKVYFPSDDEYSYLVKKSKWNPNDTTYANIVSVVDGSNYEWTSYTGFDLGEYRGLRTLLFLRKEYITVIEPTNKGNKNLLDKGDF